MRLRRGAVLSLLLTPLCISGAGAASVPTEQAIRFGRFGTVLLYSRSANPSDVVLFVSGDGGWNLGVVDMARALSTLDALVVGIDITKYLKALEASPEKCSYPAADFEALSQFIQKRLDRPRYSPPVLCGYSSGATLVYAALVQAPPGTFKGGISMGFCPDLQASKPFCRGNGLVSAPGPHGKGYSFAPAPSLETPWVALQGEVDQVCDGAATERYVKQVGHAEIVALPGVGHGFSVEKNWMPQLKRSFERLARGATPDPTLGTVETREADGARGDAGAGGAEPAAQGEPELKDLPLVEVPAKSGLGDTLAVLLSGDGGWAGLDKEVSKALAGQGIPVVGLNSLQYFWTPRTPDTSAKDLDRILRYYLRAWRKEKALLLGYSRGADVLPFMAARLPQDLLSRVRLVALIGPAHTVNFEFHLSDWLGGGSHDGALPVRPEAEKLKGVKLACFYGEDEEDSLCPDLGPALAKSIRLPGGHHFGGNYTDIAERIILETQ